MKVHKFIFFVFFCIFIYINAIFAINYISAEGIFDAEVKNTGIDENNKYYVDIGFRNNLNKEIGYVVEIIYLNENLVISSKEISCSNYCVERFYLNKVFFSKHKVDVIIKNDNKYYQKILYFNLDMPKTSYDVILQPIYSIVNGQIDLVGNIFSNSQINGLFEFEIFAKSAPNEKIVFKQVCNGNCIIDYVLSSPIILDDYIVKIYSVYGDIEKTFKVILPTTTNIENNIDEFIIEENLEIEQINISQNSWNFKLNEDFEEKQKQKEKQRISIINGNNNNNSKINLKHTPDKFLYDNNGKRDDAIIKFKKNGVEVIDSNISNNENYDVEFDFLSYKVKKIKVHNTKLEGLSIGVEDLKANQVFGVPESVVSAFAINPILPNPIGTLEINFTATGTAVYKCQLYNFTTQSCYGSFVKILDTIPGQEYIINMIGVDPLFVNTVSLTSNDGRSRNNVFQLNTAPIRFGVVSNLPYNAYFRFEKVSIPVGSTVTNAYLNFTSAAARSGTITNANIYGLAQVDCAHFDVTNGGYNPVLAPLTGNLSSWLNIPAWSNSENGPNTRTPNISNIIQEIIEMPGWQINNSMCFSVVNSGSSNNAYRDIQTVGANPANLIIDYINPPTSVIFNESLVNFEIYAGQNLSSEVTIRSIFSNNNVVINKLGGAGSSFTNVNQTNLLNMGDFQEKNVLFTCNPNLGQAVGLYETIFNVNSTENPTGNNITIYCDVKTIPKMTFILPTTISPVNVNDGENFTLKFNITDDLGLVITSNVDVMEVKVGGIEVDIIPYVPLSFNTSYSIASQMTTPQGMTVYGNKMWVTSGDTDSVFEYYTNGTFITSYSLAVLTTDPRGITTLDGSEFWVVDNNGANPDDVILHFDSNFNYIDSFSVATETIVPYGITYDGTYFYVEDDTLDRVLRYTSAGVFLDFFSVSAYTTSPRGISTKGDKLWIIDNAGTNPDNIVISFYKNGTYIEEFSIAGETVSPAGIGTINGKQFYIGDNTNDRVLVYREKTANYISNYFEANITLPSGLAGLQNITMTCFVRKAEEYFVNSSEPYSLNFPEKTPPTTITNLKNITQRANYIYWNWTNPLDSDYSYAEIWLNGVYIDNISTPINFYNATGLISLTNYTLSIRTVDINNNINTTFVNSTAQTTIGPSINDVIPLITDTFYQNTNVPISANITSLYGISSVVAYVVWESGAQYLNLVDSDLNDIYENNFTSTSNLGFYNVSITAINIYGDSTEINTTFEIISSTPFLDTFVRSDRATTSYGKNTRINVQSTASSIRRGLIQFDTSYLPTGVRIDNAEMQLYLATYGGTQITHSIFAISSNWTNSVTWNTQPSILSTNFNSTRITSIGWKYFNLTSLVQNWYNNTIENKGVMIKEETEVTIGLNLYRSSNALTLVPTLIINYTDITPPQVSNLTQVNSYYYLNDIVPLKILVTDNIGVDTVYANVSIPGGISQRVNLTLTSPFTYEGNFSNIKYTGMYNITIVANDTNNLINNSLKFNFNATSLNLKLIKEIKNYETDLFNLNLSLQNINSYKIQNGKSVIIYVFIPNEFFISSIFVADSNYLYNAVESNTYLSSENGTIYQFELSPAVQNGYIFEGSTLGEFNLSNSWNLNFNLTGLGSYDFSKILVGFDPIEIGSSEYKTLNINKGEK